MNKLEQVILSHRRFVGALLTILQAKTDNADNDAISDEMASQAYIEQFASETFQRAEKAMSANKASRYQNCTKNCPQFPD